MDPSVARAKQSLAMLGSKADQAARARRACKQRSAIRQAKPQGSALRAVEHLGSDRLGLWPCEPYCLAGLGATRLPLPRHQSLARRAGGCISGPYGCSSALCLATLGQARPRLSSSFAIWQRSCQITGSSQSYLPSFSASLGSFARSFAKSIPFAASPSQVRWIPELAMRCQTLSIGRSRPGSPKG